MTSGALVLGVLNGMLIGLLAVGIVLVYKSNRFLNLAHAQLGALSAQLLSKFVIDWGWNWWEALAVAVPIGIGVGLLVERWVVRPLRVNGSSSVKLLLSTVGVTQVLLAVALVKSLGPNPTKLVSLGYPLPFHDELHLGGVTLGGADILTLVLLPLLGIALALFLRYTILGVMIRAAASNPDAARLSGVSAERVSALTWCIAGGLSSIAAILQSPSLGGGGAFNAAALGPALLLLALGAAAVGGFTSLSGALAGGLAIGIAYQLTLAVTASAGKAEFAIFLVIVGIVFARGGVIGRALKTVGPIVDDCPALRIPNSVRDRYTVRYGPRLLVAGALMLAISAPFIPILNDEGNRFKLALVVVYALISVSLTLATGWAGQISLGHFAVVGTAAFIAARLIQHGWSVIFLVVVCGLAGALLTAAIGLPALRVPGFALAVTTLGFAVVAPDWLFRQGWLGTTRSYGIDLSAPAVGSGLPRPASQLFVYFLALITLVITSLGVGAVRRSATGRKIIAVRDDEVKAAAFAITPATAKIAALALSGSIAGMAGVLWADAWRSVSPDQFPPALSLSILAAAVIGGMGSVSGAVAGGVLVYGTSFFIGPHLVGLFGSFGHTENFTLLLGGVGLIAVLRQQPQGLAGAVHEKWQQYVDRLASDVDTNEAASASGEPVETTGLVLAFGGVKALQGVSMCVRRREIVGLIGPNGAGKSTLINVISGTVAADAGAVTMAGVDVTRLPTEIRAALGLARSFQAASLFPGLTVLETIQVAMSTAHRPGMLASAIAAPWAKEAESRSREGAWEIVERFGLGAWAETLTADLSTGTRRICDLAAQVAAAPKLLLLDEPTAGVAQREAEAFGPLVRQIRDELDCAILIVEHDMPLLMGLCDRVYAMDAGRIIAEGTPAEVRASPAVVSSYLGTDETAIGRSGGVHDAANPAIGAGALDDEAQPVR